MKYELFQQVALACDMPDKGLLRGDIATIVEYHPVRLGEDGYSLEVFNAVGNTIAVITLPESAIQPLLSDEIFHIRSLAMA